MDAIREGWDYFEHMDMASYSEKRFGMFDGKEQTVCLECENRFAGVMIDRFGREASLKKIDAEHFKISVDVAISSQFLGWVIALGNGVRIVEPQSVVKQIRQEGQRICEMYD